METPAIETETAAAPVVTKLRVIKSPATTVKEWAVSELVVFTVCVKAAIVRAVSTPFFLTTITVVGVLSFAVPPLLTKRFLIVPPRGTGNETLPSVVDVRPEVEPGLEYTVPVA